MLKSNLVGYSDPSLGIGDPDEQSPTGISVQAFGDPVGWSTKRQKEEAKSFVEAEYLAFNKLCKGGGGI